MAYQLLGAELSVESLGISDERTLLVDLFDVTDRDPYEAMASKLLTFTTGDAWPCSP